MPGMFCVKAVRHHRTFVTQDPGGNRDDFAGLKGMGIPSCLRSRSFSVRGRGPAPVLCGKWWNRYTREPQKLSLERARGFEARLADQFLTDCGAIGRRPGLKTREPFGMPVRARPVRPYDPIASIRCVQIPTARGVPSGLLNRDARVRDPSSGASLGQCRCMPVRDRP